MDTEVFFRDSELTEFCIECLRQYGMSEDNAIAIAKHLVQTDKWGVFSHGTRNLYNYIRKSTVGGVSFTETPEIIDRYDSLVIIDGRNSMGFISSNMAMEMACDMAKQTGIAMAIVKNSCHFGAAGCYSNIAAQRGMIGGAFSNVDSHMAIPGARGAVMGQNPMSLAAPATIIPSVFLDISTSNVASLRVVNARRMKETIPKDWIIDKNGNPTDDPSNYPEEGALQPMAQHKGYGIALFIEIVTSVIAGGIMSMSASIPSWNLQLDTHNEVSHSFIAIDASKFFEENGFTHRIDTMIDLIHQAPRATGVERLYVPGEMEWERSKRAEKQGICLPPVVYDELLQLSKMSGIPLKCMR